MPTTLPSSELTPVAVTSALPLPRVTMVPAKTMFVWSMILVSFGKVAVASLALETIRQLRRIRQLLSQRLQATVHPLEHVAPFLKVKCHLEQ